MGDRGSRVARVARKLSGADPRQCPPNPSPGRLAVTSDDHQTAARLPPSRRRSVTPPGRLPQRAQPLVEQPKVDLLLPVLGPEMLLPHFQGLEPLPGAVGLDAGGLLLLDRQSQRLQP